jgi:ABC-2 type transport system permease protein
MNTFKTIFLKEFRSYFYTPLAYVFIGMFVLFMGLVFTSFLQSYIQYTQQSQFGMGQQVTIDRLAEAFYSQTHVLLLIMVPFFTMRLFTSETQQNTLALLMTSPVKTTQLVLAKFSGAASIVLIMLAMTLVFPFFLFIFSQEGAQSAGPDLGIVIATYVGLLLISFTYVAIGTFWSSVTDSQMIALVFTFFTVFGLTLISIWAESTTGALQAMIKQMSVSEQFTSFAKGNIELKSVVMFLSYIFFFLFLSNRSIESRAWRS